MGVNCVAMAGRFKSKLPRRRHFIRQWREYQGMTLEELGSKVGMSAANLSRLEAHRQDYSQGLLETLAEVLRCDLVDLLMVDPNDATGPSWREIDAIIRATRQTGR